jgi:hypothetical protein
MAISLREFTDINPPMFQDREAPPEVAVDQVSMTSAQPKIPAGMTGDAAKYLKDVQPFLEDQRKAQTEKDIFESEVKNQESIGKAKMGERMAEAYKAEKTAIEGSPEFSNLRKLEDDLMSTEFIPTQDNAKDLGGLFSLIGVIGWAIGGSGKENAIQAMTAMNGMLSGYQKGRTDLYKREKDIFDTKMKALQTKTLTLSNRLKQIAELAAIDTKAANQEAENLFYQNNADFYLKIKDKYGLKATVELAKNNVEAINKAYEIMQKEKDRAEKEKVKGGYTSALLAYENVSSR